MKPEKCLLRKSKTEIKDTYNIGDRKRVMNILSVYWHSIGRRLRVLLPDFAAHFWNLAFGKTYLGRA